MKISTRSGMRIRRSIHDRLSLKSNNRSYLSTSCPISRQSKLPLLIKGTIALDISKKSTQKRPKINLSISFAAETDKGLTRDYNEDKFSVLQNSNSHFFGLYDGHGGSGCSDFLSQNLHNFILNDPDLSSDPKNVVYSSFIKAENLFLEEARRNNDRSGSCALVCVILNDRCLIGNLGDSRAVLSMNKGSKVFPLSRDHKPEDQGEMARITQAGGYVYQNHKSKHLIGPHRVFPGRLSVSRAIGDIHAKHPQYGGNANVVIPTPELKLFRITSEHDFIILGSDGIFDKIDSQRAVECVWQSFREHFMSSDKEKCAFAAKRLMSLAFERRTSDNVTVIVIIFSCFNS